MSAPSVVVTPAEAAAMLGVSRPTLYNIVNRGELEIVKIGRCARIRRADVLALVGIFEAGPDRLASS